MSTAISASSEARQVQREATLFALAFIFLTAGAVGLLLAPGARLSEWSAVGSSWQHLLFLPIWAVSAWLIHRSANRHLPHRDPYLLPVAFLLSGWGILSIWRLLPDFGLRQTAWLVLGCLVLHAIMRFGQDLEWLRRYRYLWLAGGLILTALTLFLGTHPSGGDPKLWLGCCGLYFQPSEVLRLLLVAYFASYVSDQLLRSDAGESEVSLTRVLMPLAVIWGLSIALLFVQRDLGTATLFMMLFAILLYGASGRRQVLVVGAVMVLIAAVFASLTVEVVRVRALAWLAPWGDPIGAGYQIIQSLMALAGGGVLGQGIGLGSPGFIPAAHTDFIFAAVVEEWGLAGGLALLGLLLLLGFRGLRLAGRRSRTFDMILAGGLSTGYLLQAALISGGVTRMLPLTGVTLPFVSYGGSSLITSFAALALLLQLSSRPRTRHPTPGWIRHVGLAALVVYAALGLTLIWWSVIRSPELRQRADNPRRALAGRYSVRGQIRDRSGAILADTRGLGGALERVYPRPSVSHVVGFDSSRFGQAGIEASMDPWLRGMQGPPPWQVWWKQILTGSPPVGGDVRLNLEAGIQDRAVEVMQGRTGAMVIMEVASGEVITLASAPAFDSSRIADDWQSLVADPRSPLLNRATQAHYQPGTSLAPLLYSWALAQGTDLSQISQHGLDRAVPVDGSSLGCARGSGVLAFEGLGRALANACPAPWGDLAEILGPARLSEFQDAFGLDASLEVRLAQASSPGGETGDDPFAYGIGQGPLTVSPLQLARAYTVIVNRGTIREPEVIDAVRRPGEPWSAYSSDSQSERVVDVEAAELTLVALSHEDTMDYSGEAISGKGDRRLAWHVAADLRYPSTWLVLVVLEDGSPGEARSLGLGMLELVRNTLP